MIWEMVLEPFAAFGFMRRALLGCVAVSVGATPVGVFLMLRRMSLTGDFLSAADALRAGLVTEVVAHDELLPTAHRVAATIAANDPAAVGALLASYRRMEAVQTSADYEIEAETSQAWLARGFDPAAVERRRAAIVERGRSQTTPGKDLRC